MQKKRARAMKTQKRKRVHALHALGENLAVAGQHAVKPVHDATMLTLCLTQ